ncbi:MAG: hypothetical protein IT186_26650 [Acidobacteria bacterium]|nr:hypothetical protein [Acidobacteriota bacterium]MCG3194866.1 hypothetical protein [Thermoanaerobaculia bacterium]MCK6681436.1 hypothetical protein [Thermoanaerobaculia bacterium]
MDQNLPLTPECDFAPAGGEAFTREPPSGEPMGEIPEAFRGRILVDAIHDGSRIPPEYLVREDGSSIAPGEIRSHFELDRDWGASLVASRLAGALGLDGYYRVNVARVLMDYGRFPGSTTAGADYLSRFAINYPFSEWLSHDARRRLLEEQYDACSRGMEDATRGKKIKIACHTYDRKNPSGTLRPHVSLVTRSLAYQRDSRMPVGVFDPLYPDVLAEFTADRVLTDRISLDLEKRGIPVAHNYPYCLPEGSIEVRAQVWYFFDFVRRRFEAERPETVSDPAFRAVWEMLLDTNRRSAESDTLRSYIHFFRRPPSGLEDMFHRVRRAYDEVRKKIESNDRQIVTEYRYSEERLSTIAIEVRKDLVWEFSEEDRPVRPRPEVAGRIAEAIAAAVLRYLAEDLSERKSSDVTLEFLEPPGAEREPPPR